MRQPEDSQLVDRLNHVRVADIKPTNIELLVIKKVVCP